MPTETTLDTVLNGIITCNQCNAGMALKQDEATGQLYFTCSQQAGQSFTSCLTRISTRTSSTNWWSRRSWKRS